VRGDWTDAFPGADVVDAMNVDYCNNWPYAATLEEFESHLDQLDGFGGPKGLAAHTDFAASVGLPLSLGSGPASTVTRAVIVRRSSRAGSPSSPGTQARVRVRSCTRVSSR